MNEELKQKFLQWCFEEILKNVWDTARDCDSRMARILARANMGHLILTGTDDMKEELWDALSDDAKQEISRTELTDWETKVPAT